MLESIVTEAVRVIFGEALSRLVRRIFRDAEGAPDDLLLQLVIDTLRRHADKLDCLESKIDLFENVLARRFPREIIPDISRSAHGNPPALPGNGQGYAIYLSTSGQFRRTYYGSAFLGRNSLRGAATIEELALLSGTGVYLKSARAGVYFIPLTNFPDHCIDGQFLKSRNTTLLGQGRHDIVIGTVALTLEVGAWR